MGSVGEEMQLVERITSIYNSIVKLPSLSPSPEVNKLFTELVHTCISVIPIDVPALPAEVQAMRSHLISLCAQTEGLRENHYADVLAAFDNPLDHLHLFPSYNKYLRLAQLEYSLLAQHAGTPAPARVAFLGSGPLPLTSIVLAQRHLRAAQVDNYDLDPAANERAARLVRGDPALAARMAFHTVDVLSVSQALRGYDVVFLAALVGIGREEKARVVEHLARHMAPGAVLMARSARGARAFLYPVVETAFLRGFEMLTVHHPKDEVITSLVVARKLPHAVDPGLNVDGNNRISCVGGDEAVQSAARWCRSYNTTLERTGGIMDQEVGLEVEELPA